MKTERKARLAYRRAVDGGYLPIVNIVETLEATKQLKALGPQLKSMLTDIEANEPNTMVESVAAMSIQVRAIKGASKLRKRLTKVRRALKSRKPKKTAQLKR